MNPAVARQETAGRRNKRSTSRIADLAPTFLAHNGIIRERGARGSNNHCLGPAVELGHQLNLQPSAAATVHYSRYVTTGEMAPPKAQ